MKLKLAQLISLSFSALPYVIAAIAFVIVSKRSCCNKQQLRLQGEALQIIAGRVRFVEKELPKKVEFRIKPAVPQAVERGNAESGGEFR